MAKTIHFWGAYRLRTWYNNMELEPAKTDPEAGDLVLDIGTNYEGEPELVISFEKLDNGETVLITEDKNGIRHRGLVLRFFKEDYGDYDYKNRIVERKLAKIWTLLFW